MPKIMLNCRPNGRRRLGTSLKRLSDEAGTGLSRPDTWRTMMMMMMTAWTNLRSPRTDTSIKELRPQCTDKDDSFNYSTTASFHIFSYSLFNDIEPSSPFSLTYWHIWRNNHKPTNHIVPVACRTGRNDPKTAHGGHQRNSCPCLPKEEERCLLSQAWPAAPVVQVSVDGVVRPVDGVTPVCTSLWEAEWRRWSLQWSDSGNDIALPVVRTGRPALVLALWWTSQCLNCGAGTGVSHGVGRLTICRQGWKCRPY